MRISRLRVRSSLYIPGDGEGRGSLICLNEITLGFIVPAPRQTPPHRAAPAPSPAVPPVLLGAGMAGPVPSRLVSSHPIPPSPPAAAPDPRDRPVPAGAKARPGDSCSCGVLVQGADVDVRMQIPLFDSPRVPAPKGELVPAASGG